MRQRLRVTIHGAVQGVGFRPFVYRLATELGLDGWVLNSDEGVVIEVEGDPASLHRFLLRVEPEKPAQASIYSIEATYLDAEGYCGFQIRASEETGRKTALILPDLAVCPDCAREVLDSKDRRFLYPFTNCTNCGPRFTIIEALPYDRSNTSMKRFVMCDACRAEYENPRDRRFHAQPNACPACGPHLELWDRDGRLLASHHSAVLEAAAAIRNGLVVAVKGLGGFHLVTDARNDAAVHTLRERKRREAKPFALMAPNLKWIRSACVVSPLEERLLRSAQAPIVMLARNADRMEVSDLVAPASPELGIMLPYTPLHLILMEELGFPVVATSGNASDEPICTDEHEALQRLGILADLFLVHNRPIVRHADDSIVRILEGRELVLRRARGYAPLPITVDQSLPPILGVGAHLKNTVALAVEHTVFVSQHIGDLETKQANDAFRRATADLPRLYAVHPRALACDLHPDYASTRYAHASGLPVVPVQHHYAHALACLAENRLRPPALAVTWDGTGYGTDGTIWGGEFLLITDEGFERAAFLRPFFLPGGEQAVREPRRAALGALWAMRDDLQPELLPFLYGPRHAADANPADPFTARERAILLAMLRQGINCPVTTSVGRLFDAAASLLGICHTNRFEGQAAMLLTWALPTHPMTDAYGSGIIQMEKDAILLDWAPIFRGLMTDIQAGAEIALITARFHNALAAMLVEAAVRIGEPKVLLTGGCFQNRYLTERSIAALRQAGLQPYWHQRIPPNDGGVALGQILAAARVTAGGG
ncbi:MAG: carbamoyltransferase HypF [Chthonomonadales bacterium]